MAEMATPSTRYVKNVCRPTAHTPRSRVETGSSACRGTGLPCVATRTTRPRHQREPRGERWGRGAGTTGGTAGGTTGPGTAGGLTGVAADCRGGATAPGVTANEIKVGAIVTASGPLPGATEGSFRGAQAYLAKVNAAGGVCGR